MLSFVSFSCLIALPMTSHMMLNRGGECDGQFYVLTGHGVPKFRIISGYVYYGHFQMRLAFEPVESVK